MYIEQICNTDFKKLFQESNLEKMADYYFCSMMRLFGVILPLASKQSKRRVEKMTAIFDFKDVNMFKFISGDMKDFLKIGSNISQSYFPETSKRIVIINAPGMFGLLWKVVQIFLDKATIQKVQIHSGDTYKVLSKIIDDANIPHWYGGQSRERLEENPGPWQEELLKSKQEGNLLCSDQSIYEEFYLLDREVQKTLPLKETFEQKASYESPMRR